MVSPACNSIGAIVLVELLRFSSVRDFRVWAAATHSPSCAGAAGRTLLPAFLPSVPNRSLCVLSSVCRCEVGCFACPTLPPWGIWDLIS